MIETCKVLLFVLATAGFGWVSWSSLRSVKHHGFYRFFAWESMLILLLINVNQWFTDPLCLRQIVSWFLLSVSIVFICQGVWLFHRKGGLGKGRNDAALLGIEKTTELVTTGVYRYIRHPFYSSLLFLNWGILLKNVSWVGLLLALAATLLLVLTARKEETENIRHFGAKYQDYMKHTTMFVPFIF